MRKPLFWIGSSRADLREFPEDVRNEAGFTLHLAQQGDKALNAVPMMGFGSAKVLEVVIDNAGNTYRAVYTVKFAKAVYVLHAFQKKSRKGIETPKPDIDLIHHRLAAAEKDYLARFERPKYQNEQTIRYQRNTNHGKAKR
jgi:phage-related protein